GVECIVGPSSVALPPEPQLAVVHTERPARKRQGRLDVAGPVCEYQFGALLIEPEPGEMRVSTEQPLRAARQDRPRTDFAQCRLHPGRVPGTTAIRVGRNVLNGRCFVLDEASPEASVLCDQRRDDR